MRKTVVRYCSWCLKKTKHTLVNKNVLERDDYQCMSCHSYTVECRYCKNMATYKPSAKIAEKLKLNDSWTINWASELCAEHDGTVADFSKLDKKLPDLKNYKRFLKHKKPNLLKTAKITGGMVAGTTMFAGGGLFAAPQIAATLGATGWLGLASTGAAINTLSGAALGSASLAAIGPGGVAGGYITISLLGGGLGARAGGLVSNNLFGKIKGFEIIQIKKGKGPALVFINGFLSQKNYDYTDWIDGVKNKYPNNPYYYVNWESQALYDLGLFVVKGTLKKFLIALARRGSKTWPAKLNPANWADMLSDLLGNPLHVALIKAKMTGYLLADLLARTTSRNGFILMGHSLGARVIHYILEATASNNKTNIKDVYLFGGAIGSEPTQWKNATNAIKGKIYNCYSRNDQVLKILYPHATVLDFVLDKNSKIHKKVVSAFITMPVGLDRIKIRNPKLKNLNCTSFVNGHMSYKDSLPQIFKKIDL